MLAITMNEKKMSMNLKRVGNGIWEGLKRGKGREKHCT